MSQFKPVKQKEFLLTRSFLFYLGLQLTGRAPQPPHQGGRSGLLSLLVPMLLFIQKRPHRHTRIMSDQVSGHTVAQSRRHMTLTITTGDTCPAHFAMDSQPVQLWKQKGKEGNPTDKCTLTMEVTLIHLVAAASWAC